MRKLISLAHETEGPHKYLIGTWDGIDYNSVLRILSENGFRVLKSHMKFTSGYVTFVEDILHRIISWEMINTLLVHAG